MQMHEMKVSRGFRMLENKQREFEKELQGEHIYYFLMQGYEDFHDGDEWIGIYEDLQKLRAAYVQAVDELNAEHAKRLEHCKKIAKYAMSNEKIKIHAYHGEAGHWIYDIPQEKLWNKSQLQVE